MSSAFLKRFEVVTIAAAINKLIESNQNFNSSFANFLCCNKRLLLEYTIPIRDTMELILRDYKNALKQNEKQFKTMLAQQFAKCENVEQNEQIKIEFEQKQRDEKQTIDNEFADAKKDSESYMNEQIEIKFQSMDKDLIPTIPSKLYDDIFPLIAQ